MEQMPGNWWDRGAPDMPDQVKAGVMIEALPMASLGTDLEPLVDEGFTTLHKHAVSAEELAADLLPLVEAGYTDLHTHALSTLTPVNAVASTLSTVLTGTHNDLTYTAILKGESGDAITIAYVDPGTPSAAIAVSVVGTAMAVSLETDAGTVASAIIGAGANGEVTVATESVGVFAGLTIEVVLGIGLDLPLSAGLVSGDIVVTLGTDGAGLPDDTKNTATLVGAALSLLDGFGNGFVSGDGSTPFTAPEGPTAFAGGAAPAITTIASAIKTVIDADEDAHLLVTVANTGGNNGTGVVTALSATPLAGGIDGTPAVAGALAYDDDYLYVALTLQTVATDYWRRVAFETF